MIPLPKRFENYFDYRKGNRELGEIKFPTPIIPKIYYALLFGCFGSYRPFLPLFLQEINIDPKTIGLILFFPPLITFIVSPMWGGFSDKHNCHKKTFLLASSISCVLIFILKFIRQPIIASIIIMLNAVFWAPLIPIIDSNTYKILGKSRDLYGQQRLYGSISFAACAYFVSFLISRFDSTSVSWINYAVVMAVLVVMVKLFYNAEPVDLLLNESSSSSEEMAIEMEKTKGNEDNQININNDNNLDNVSEIYSDNNDIDNEIDNESLLFLSPQSHSTIAETNILPILDQESGTILTPENDQENTSNNDSEELNDNSNKEPKRLSFFQSSKILLSNKKILLVLFNSLIISTGMSVVNNFLGITIENDLHGGTQLIGVAVICNVSFEIIFFFFGKTLLLKVGVFRMIIMSHVALIARAISYCFILHFKLNAWCILPVELLHGIVFSTIWSSGSKIVNENSPKGLEVSGQSLFFGVYLGLGAGVGAFIGGTLYHSHGPILMYGTVAVGVSIGLMIFLLFEFVILDTNNDNSSPALYNTINQDQK